MMLTPYDISVMERDVREIISMWNMRLTFLKPLPVDKQPNWNIHMHEYSGPIHYIQFDNVQVERKDQMVTNIYTIDMVEGAGDQRDTKLLFTTSDLNTFIDETCQLCYMGKKWRIANIYPRIGEKIMSVYELIGSSDVWADTPCVIIDVAQMPVDEEHGDPDLSMLDGCIGDCGDCTMCKDGGL